MAMKNLTLKQKFFVLLGVILLSFIISGAINYSKIMSIKQNWDSYQSNVKKRQTLLMEIKSDFGYGGIIHNFKNFVLRGQAKHADRFADKYKAITKAIKEYSLLAELTNKEKQALLSIKKVVNEYNLALQLTQTMKKDGKSISEIDRTVKVNDSPAYNSFKSLILEYVVMTDQITKTLASSIKGAIITIIISASLAFAITILLTLMISNNIISTIQYMRDKMVAIEKTGDLTGEIQVSSNDESGQMAMAFNSMVKKISAIVLEIKRSSAQMDSASDHLSSTSNHLSSGGGEQLTRSSQVAAASQEMSSTVIEVAKNAAGAADAAKEANKAASHGGDIVKKTIDSMNGIADTTKVSSGVIAGLGDRSNEIGNIIGVIDDIADQTNLLALNAAIEAARAGEQGRGFAVVADEVRKLAERTTKATKEIGGMIKAIQADTSKALSSMEAEVKVVEDGVHLACEAGSAIETIIEQVDTVTSMIQQIAIAADEQSTAADQISSDVEAVADITRESTESTEQITSASEEIAKLAIDLQRSISMFNVNSK